MEYKSFDELKQNIIEDIEDANIKQISKIYEALKIALKKFDKDGLGKNLLDILNKLFKPKREKCKIVISDLFESKEKLSQTNKDLLREELIKISDIHRTIAENIVALLDAL